MSYIPIFTKLFRVFGLELRKYNPDKVMVNNWDTGCGRLLLLFKHFKINKVLDVGANTGQFVRMLRKYGYLGKIVSFEPQSRAYKILSKTAKNDSGWDVTKLALGSGDVKTLRLNISGNSLSSSFLDILPKHVDILPSSAYVSNECVDISALDDIFHQYYSEDDNCFLKIDVQGYEMEVLRGARNSLKKITGLQIEMPLVNLYEGEADFIELMDHLFDNNFKLMSIGSGFCDPISGQLLQVDGVFFNKHFVQESVNEISIPELQFAS